MTRLHYVKKAQKDIYQQGKKIQRKNKKGVTVLVWDRTVAANKEDVILIKKGEPYYWWQFAFRSKQISKNRPQRSRYATQSEHLGAIYDIEDQVSAMSAADLSSDCLDDIKSDIEQIIDICQERLDNMPEQLQQAPSGEILQQYIDGCEAWLNDLEAVDLSELDNNFEADAEIEVDENDYRDENGSVDEDEYKEAIAEKAQELEDDLRQSLLEEIQNCQYQG